MLSALMEKEVMEAEVQHEAFKITDLESSTWGMRKIRAYMEKINEVKSVAKAEIDRVKEWEEKETAGLKESIAFFEGLLAEYYASQKAIDPKFKLNTPYGKVTSRKQPDTFEYDEEKFLEWAEENNMELVRIKTEINKEEAKKYLIPTENGVVDATTGEILKSVRFVQGETKISVKVEL